MMNFKEGHWKYEINVTDFVKTNITPYEGDASFLTRLTLQRFQPLLRLHRDILIKKMK